VERKLDEVGLGVEAKVSRMNTTLEYCKTKGIHRKWCFVVTPKGLKSKPLLQSERPVLIEQARMIPKLLDVLRERVEKLTARLNLGIADEGNQ